MKGTTVARSLSGRVDLVHVFSKSAAELDAKLRKVCAIGETWSGLKLVTGKELRGSR